MKQAYIVTEDHIESIADIVADRIMSRVEHRLTAIGIEKTIDANKASEWFQCTKRHLLDRIRRGEKIPHIIDTKKNYLFYASELNAYIKNKRRT